MKVFCGECINYYPRSIVFTKGLNVSGKPAKYRKYLNPCKLGNEEPKNYQCKDHKPDGCSWGDGSRSKRHREVESVCDFSSVKFLFEGVNADGICLRRLFGRPAEGCTGIYYGPPEKDPHAVYKKEMENAERGDVDGFYVAVHVRVYDGQKWKDIQLDMSKLDEGKLKKLGAWGKSMLELKDRWGWIVI